MVATLLSLLVPLLLAVILFILVAPARAGAPSGSPSAHLGGAAKLTGAVDLLPDSEGRVRAMMER